VTRLPSDCRYVRTKTACSAEELTLAPPDQFVDYYYKAFDSDRNSLSALYRPQSMMTWEKEPFMGEKILEKLVVRTQGGHLRGSLRHNALPLTFSPVALEAELSIEES
jgi:hypothetical protein